MYEFVDTIEAVSANTALPAEALQINGSYIENLVDGYRTLTVSGREMLNAELEELTIDSVNGSEYLYRTYPPRDITVEYQIISSSAGELMQRFNQLNGILDAENATLIFKDEPDKYFIGTRSDIDLPEEGRTSTRGKFVLHCSDPFKYSTVEKEFTAAVNDDGIMAATIDNAGTIPVTIDYEITHNHENGYIGIVSEGGVMEYGCIDEVDKEQRVKSQTLVNYKTGPAISAGMTSGGIVTEPAKIPTNGTFKTVTIGGYSCLALDSVGSGSYWHGAAKTLTLPADSSGNVGATNFKVAAKVWFETGLVPQTGLIELVVGDEDGNLLCDIHLVKNNTAKNSARCIYKLQGMGDSQNDVCKTTFEPNYKSVMNVSGGSIYIEKKGELFTFYSGVKTYSIRAPKLANKKALTVTVFLGQYGTRGASNLVSRMYFRELSFRSDSVSYTYDVPNRYQEGDVLTIDGETTKVYVNGIPSLGDEVKGTKYFQAPPGEMLIQFYHSDFSDPAPTIKARIREAYL